MEPKKVLVVDDELDIREHLGAMLRSSGFEVIAAEDGLQAVKFAGEHNPDIIILDVNLPDIDGGEVANRLSRNPSTSAIPIVYLTGLITKEEIKDPEKIGKSFVVAKPVVKTELLSVISQALQK